LPGEKIPESDEANTQDFVPLSTPNMPLGTVRLFHDAIVYSTQYTPLLFAAKMILTGRSRVLKELDAARIRPTSPLEIRYWSTTPYRFGADRVVKYSLLPTSDATSALPPPLADDYLSAAMETRLSREGVSFALAVQVRADGMPVHDAAPRWDETVSPFQTVATLTIPAQVFRTPERGRRSEELSFSPALPMQFIHEEDVGQAFVLCTVATGPPGAYNITGDGVVTAVDVARELGFIPIPLPAGPFHSAARVVSALPALPPAAQWLEACGAPGGSLSAYRHRPAGSFPARLRPDRRSRAGRRHRPARPVRRRRRLQVLHRPGAQGLRDRRHRPQTRADEQGRTLAAAHHTDPRRRPRPQTRPPAGQNLLHPDDRTRRRPPESHLRGRRPPGRTRLGRDGPRHALCDLRQRRKPVTPEDARKIIAERWTVPRRSANAAAAASRRERLLNRPYGLAHEATFPGPDPLALPAASSTTPEPPPTPARMSRPAIRPWRHAGIPQGLRTCPSPRPSLTRTKPKTSAS